jgi:DNA-binding CsgD family transcriptional regulator
MTTIRVVNKMRPAAAQRPDSGVTGNRMQDAERRFMHWVDLVDHLLRCPAPELPTGLLTAELAGTFDTNASWNWADPDGTFGFEIHDRPTGWPSEADLEFWAREALPLHPLVMWFSTTGDSAAMTIGRVPDGVASRRGRALVAEYLTGVGLEQQLSIPYRLGPGMHRAFVMATSGKDYSDEHVTLARRIQSLIVLLARNQAVLERPRPTGSVVPLQRAGSGLTCRELAVLQLLAEGLTAESIGRRLGVSRHTVRKHLEHVYRKLGVTDRLVAVREARAQGLLDEPPGVADRS